MSRPRALLSAALLVVALFAAHWPALGAGFLRFDDDRIVTGNPLFEAPLFDALAGISHPGRTLADAYLPVAHLSLLLDWRLLGPSPFGLHLANLLWHLLACLALLALGRRMGLPQAGALLGALLFAVHPALAEPVAWVSGRKCLLAGLFSFLALCFWLDALGGRRRAGLLAGLFTILAVYSNGAALVLLPWAAALALFRRVRERTPFPWATFLFIGLVCLGAALHHSWLAAREGTAEAAAGRPLALAAGTQAWYLHRAFVPLALSSDYPYSVYKQVLSTPGPAEFFLALLPVLGIAALCVFRRRLAGFPWAAAGGGLALFVLGLLPFNNLYPATSVLLADRYLYLPLAGLALAAGTLLGLHRPLALLSGCLIGLALPLLASLAWARSAQFRDDRSLWQAALEAEPASSVARFNLATDLLHRKGRRALKGDEGRAVRELLAGALADAARPQLRSRILAQIAVVRSWGGDPSAAAESLGSAIAELERLPESPALNQAWGRLALERLRALNEAGLQEPAALLTARIEERLPRWPEGEVGLASFQVMRVEALLRQGETSQAEALAQEVKSRLELRLAKGPPSFPALLALARLEATRLAGGSFVRALGLFKQARELEPGRIETYVEIANLYQQLEPPQLSQAMEELNLGLSRRPGDPDLLLRKGLLLVQQDRLEAGLPWLEQARTAHPGREDIREALLAALLLGFEDALQDRARRDPASWLRRLQALDRFHPEVLAATGRTLAAGGKLRESVPFFEQALALGSRPSETRAALVEALKKLGYQNLLGRREEALEFFHRAATLLPGDPGLVAVQEILDGEVRRLLVESRTLLAVSDRDAALARLDRARRLVLPDALPAAALVLEAAQARMASGLDGVDAEFRTRGERLLAVECGGAPTPERAAARVEGWLGEGQSSRALWTLELLLLLADPHPAWPRLQARTLLARGEFAAARDVLQKGRERFPGFPELEEELGRLICQEALAGWQAGEAESALEALLEGASLCRRLLARERLEPLFAQVDALLRNQALAALEQADQAREQGEWTRAAELYARGARLLPPGVEPEFRFQARVFQALCWRGMGQPLRALGDLELLDREARSLGLPFVPVVRARAALLFTLDRPAEARQVLESWLAAFPEAPDREEVQALLSGHER